MGDKMKIKINTSDGSIINFDNVVRCDLSDNLVPYIRVFYMDENNEQKVRKCQVRYNNITEIEVNELCTT